VSRAPVRYFVLSAVLYSKDGVEPRVYTDSTVGRFTTSRGRQRAVRNAEQRIMRRNLDWKEIRWDFGPIVGAASSVMDGFHAVGATVPARSAK
jgi:hypothetical protein